MTKFQNPKHVSNLECRILNLFRNSKFGFRVSHNGQALIQVLVFGAIAIVLIGGYAQWAGLQLRAARVLQYREQALVIAEAGIEYYRWHLAHASQDFQDGTGGPGPYVHPYNDKDGNQIGSFTLTITPPLVGSTKATILSEGRVLIDPNIRRAIRTELAIPSWAKYAVAANDVMRFGTGTEVFGPIHSNGGIRFDGLAHNLVTSAQEKYNDPDHTGADEFGVHTHIAPLDPLPPAAVPVRLDVFAVGRDFPVPALDFAGLSGDLANLKAKAQIGGLYIPGSGSQGYNIVLFANDTFDLYRVTGLVAAPSGCRITTQAGWGTWSIASQVFIANYSFPQNGVVFVEDHVWVEGQLVSARLAIASGRFPETPATATSITVNRDLAYAAYEGAEALGLIAQQDFNVGLKSEDDLVVDGALVAKNGRVGRFYYRPSCGTEYVRNSITLHGMIATNQRYGFAYTDGTGYQTRNINYDANLLYAPPPSFPLTSDQYSTLSWEEIE